MSTRRFCIAGNWKMNNGNSETTEFLLEMISNLPTKNNLTKLDIVIAPPFLSLENACHHTEGTPLRIASQNMHWAEKGAYTGEVSGKMLKEIGVTHAIIGHSERRQYFGETNETVNLRVKAALSNGLTPIVCIGETLEERENGTMNSVLERQIRTGLQGLDKDDLKKIIIAYEPVWAIGTGKTATPKQAQEAHKFVRSLLPEMLQNSTQILYGGSLKPSNAKELLAQEDIDGGLIGGASLLSDDFLAIINTAIELS